MLKYPCLVLDHDDTVVQSEATVNYPCFVEFLAKYRPGTQFTLEQYMTGCSQMPFVEMCRKWFQLTDVEMQAEYHFWKDYIRSYMPAAFPGIGEILRKQRESGGLICVVSLSSEERIRRDYRAHFGMEPDAIFDCDLPREQQKPSPYALNKIMQTYGLRPDQLLVVDDMKFAVPMARAVGAPIAFAAWGRQDFPGLMEEMKQLCDFSFDSVENLYNFLFD